MIANFQPDCCVEVWHGYNQSIKSGSQDYLLDLKFVYAPFVDRAQAHCHDHLSYNFFLHRTHIVLS